MFYLKTPLAGKDMFENPVRRRCAGAVTKFLRWPTCVGCNFFSCNNFQWKTWFFLQLLRRLFDLPTPAAFTLLIAWEIRIFFLNHSVINRKDNKYNHHFWPTYAVPLTSSVRAKLRCDPNSQKSTPIFLHPVIHSELLRILPFSHFFLCKIFTW